MDLPDWLNLPAGIPVALILGTAGPACVALAYVVGRRSGLRKLQAHLTTEERRTDRWLFITALTAAICCWLVSVFGSAGGLMSFGTDELGWSEWWQRILVPISLDGGSVAFEMLAFRAVSRRKSPYISYAIVWACTIVSVVINLTHGGSEHHGAAGGYLAFLSMINMAMFYTFLSQFKEAAQLARKAPKFGARWITYFYNTACAWLAWTNHPDPANPEPTVPNAIVHLEKVRSAKRAARYRVDVERSARMPWWTALVPGWQARVLRAALTDAAEQHQAAQDAAAQDLQTRARELAALREEHQALADLIDEAEGSRSGAYDRARETTAKLAALEAQHTADQTAHAAALEALQAEHAADRAHLEAKITELVEADRRARADEQTRRAETEKALRAEHLQTLQALREEQGTTRTEWSTRLEQLEGEHRQALRRIAELTEGTSALRAECAAERARSTSMEASAEETRRGHVEELEALRTAWTEEVRSIRSAHAEELEALHSEHLQALRSTRAERSSAPRTSRTPSTPPAPPGAERPAEGGDDSKPKLTDAEAITLMADTEPDPTHRWSKTRVAKLTGAGWGGDRLDRLIAGWAEEVGRRASGSAQSVPSEPVLETVS